MTKHKVYDEVWIMEGNRPVKRKVFAVVESMDFSKKGTEMYYHLVGSTCGAGWGNNSGEMLSGEIIFPTKKALVESL